MAEPSEASMTTAYRALVISEGYALKSPRDRQKAVAIAIDADKAELVEALQRIEQAADPLLADQTHAGDRRIGLVQPVTADEMDELIMAVREARRVLENHQPQQGEQSDG